MAGAADEAHMRRAIALAAARMGTTWPNPTVGCVIVRDGAVVGEAATGPGGADSAASRLHAEEQALIAAGGAARGADAFVTLEPCARRSSGRASCTERLIDAAVAKVFVACLDPSANAAGEGAKRLERAGIAVENGILADEAAPLYSGYRHRLATGRPLILAAADGSGFDAEFSADAGEDLAAALLRHGALGYTKLWVPAGSFLAERLRGQKLLEEAERN
jgi:diaminohydroxyphosphoribosylaminopyrimidine deaminase/5-amino-6-(5-phosphoribosylamino)uracil reductase